MAIATFNALKFIEIIETAGFDKNQATTFAKALQESYDTSEVATKNDILLIRSAMKELELRIVLKLGSLIVGTMGFMTAILKFT